ncbi:MAG: hypothetical protein U0X86_000734 [Wolbachia endosymbiont of Xenopsylla cheopis]
MNAVTPLIADNQGEITGRFTVPSNIPAGTKLVQFFGNQGSYAEATYTSRGTITTEERRRVIATKRIDPLAQTFTLSESRHIASVDLWFTNSGTKRVVLQIRKTNIGIPAQTVIAESYIEPHNINTDGSATHAVWPPVFCEAGQEYALVILTDDANTAVKIAEVGKYDAVNSRFVVSQPYQIGVLLSSSNASTWTPHQNLDLTFRLLAARFTENTHTIDLGKITADKTSDLIVLANIERVAFDTNAEVLLTDENGEAHHLSDNLPLILRSRLSGELKVEVNLKGSEKKSPVLYPAVQLVLGNLLESADYVSRSIPAGVDTKVTVTYDAVLPGTADAKVYLQKAEGEWQLIDLTAGKPLGESQVERTHVLVNFNAHSTKVKLVLSGTVLYRPKVRNLRIVIT